MNQLINDDDSKVYIISVTDGSTYAGFVLTWVVTASLNQKDHKILLVVSKFNSSLQFLKQKGSFIINQLSKGQKEEFFLFGSQSSTEVDKFAGIKGSIQSEGIILPGVAGHARGKIDEMFETPDRILLYCTLSQEVTNLCPPMILKDVLGQLTPHQKQVLDRKMRLDSQRDEIQFTQA